MERNENEIKCLFDENMDLDENNFERFLVNTSTLCSRSNKVNQYSCTNDNKGNADKKRQIFSIRSNSGVDSDISKSYWKTFANEHAETCIKHFSKQRQLPICPTNYDSPINFNGDVPSEIKKNRKHYKLKDLNKSEFLSRSLDYDARHIGNIMRICRSASGSLKRRSYTNVNDAKKCNITSSDTLNNVFTPKNDDVTMETKSLDNGHIESRDSNAVSEEHGSNKLLTNLKNESDLIATDLISSKEEKRRKIDSLVNVDNYTNALASPKSPRKVDDVVQASLAFPEKLKTPYEQMISQSTNTSPIKEYYSSSQETEQREFEDIQIEVNPPTLNEESNNTTRKPKLIETRRRSVFNKFKNSIRSNAKNSKESFSSNELSPRWKGKDIELSPRLKDKYTYNSEDDSPGTTNSSSTNSPASILRYRLFRNFTEPTRVLPETPKSSTGKLSRKNLWRTNSEPIPNFKEKKPSKSLYDDIKSRFMKKNSRQERILEEEGEVFDEAEYKKYQQALQRGRRAAVFSLEINQCISVTKTSISNESYCQFNFISQNTNPLLR